MKDEVLVKYAKLYFDRDRNIRGGYLFQSTWIESLLEEIIAYHFCPSDKKKRGQILSMVIPDLNFSSKIRIFLNLIKQYPKLLKQYEHFKDDLDNVRDLRNKFTHSMLDSSVNYLEKKTGKIRYIYYRNGHKQYFEITEQGFNKKINEIANLHEELGEIVKLLSQDESGSSEFIGTF